MKKTILILLILSLASCKSFDLTPYLKIEGKRIGRQALSDLFKLEPVYFEKDSISVGKVLTEAEVPNFFLKFVDTQKHGEVRADLKGEFIRLSWMPISDSAGNYVDFSFVYQKKKFD